MRVPRRASAALLPWVLLPWTLGAVGCGYTTRFALAERYESIGIELFSNESPEPDLERELHAALTRNVRDMVDASLRPPQLARLVMRGTVREYRRRSGIRSSDNVQLETGLSIRVEAELVDRLSGALVAGPATAATQVGYTLERRTASEASARARAVELISQRLVVDLVGRAAAADEIREGAEVPSGGKNGVRRE